MQEDGLQVLFEKAGGAEKGAEAACGDGHQHGIIFKRHTTVFAMAPVNEEDYTPESLPGLKMCFWWFLSLLGVGVTNIRKIEPLAEEAGPAEEAVSARVPPNELFLPQSSKTSTGEKSSRKRISISRSLRNTELAPPLNFTRRGRRESYL